MEFQVVQILEEAGANEYLTQFALHRITVETLLQMNDDALKRVCAPWEEISSSLIQNILSTLYLKFYVIMIAATTMMTKITLIMVMLIIIIIKIMMIKLDVAMKLRIFCAVLNLHMWENEFLIAVKTWWCVVSLPIIFFKTACI